MAGPATAARTPLQIDDHLVQLNGTDPEAAPTDATDAPWAARPDVDSDGDGISDLAESASDILYAVYTGVGGREALGAIGTTGFTLESTKTIRTTDDTLGAVAFPAEFAVPSADPTIRVDQASTTTVTFEEKLLHPVVVFASVGNPTTPVPVEFDRPVEVMWSSGVTVDSPSRITGVDGYAVVRLTGMHEGFTFSTLDDESYLNVVLGADTPRPVDTDGDGVADHLDTDSDDDGISDTVDPARTVAAGEEPASTIVETSPSPEADEVAPTTVTPTTVTPTTVTPTTVTPPSRSQTVTPTTVTLETVTPTTVAPETVTPTTVTPTVTPTTVTTVAPVTPPAVDDTAVTEPGVSPSS
jgi:hypothetical protein